MTNCDNIFPFDILLHIRINLLHKFKSSHSFPNCTSNNTSFINKLKKKSILNIARWVVVILMMLSFKVGVLAVGLPVCPKGASFTSGRTDKQVVAPVESLTVLSLV
ncbi:hypothetical protein T05_12643 [Trichinella murrelli]|uniref:Uncharacterized protein n=1 Tax=Trichinella murrelli TaxID=144512 RepID=A0A0V0UH71_9BILA|nr:hypothetical protein T05_12643 [Trichinella murrelli]